jgi:cytoskeletal protein CcmA (bactofilin family)
VAFKRLDSESIVPPQLTPEQRWTSTASRPAADGRSVIGSDLSIEGPSITMRCKGTLRVDGTIEANLHCAELVIGEQAVIVGSIAANKVAVARQWCDLRQ